MKRSVVVGSAVAAAAVIAIAAIVLGVGGTMAKTKISLSPTGQKTSTSPLPPLLSNQKSTAATGAKNSSSSSPTTTNAPTGTKTQTTSGSRNVTVDILKNASVMKADQKAFDPDRVKVPVGGTVTWKNSDTAAHTITSGKGPKDPQSGKLFDSGLIKPGKTFEFKFTAAGTYDYYCTIHPTMVGQITVVK